MGRHDGLNKMGGGPGLRLKSLKYRGKLFFDESKKKIPKWNGFNDTIYITGWYVIHKGEEIPLYHKDASYVSMQKYMNGDYVFNGMEIEYTIDPNSERGFVMGQEEYSGTYQMGYGPVAKLVYTKEYKDEESELKKCLESPYYFATNYLMINDEKFTTNLSEEEFNSRFIQVINQLK